MKKELLIENVLGRSADYYTKEYVENIFPKEYELVEKIFNFLELKEFEFLFETMNGNHVNLYKILEHFEDRDK